MLRFSLRSFTRRLHSNDLTASRQKRSTHRRVLSIRGVDSHSIYTVPEQVCEADVISRRAEIPLFFLLRTQGLWKHTLCAAAGRSKDLGAPCGVSRQGTAMLTWEWEWTFSNTCKNHRYLCPNDRDYSLDTTFCLWSLGDWNTPSTAHHPPQGWDPTQKHDASYVPQQRFLSLCSVCFLGLPSPDAFACAHTHTHTHTRHSHTRTLS